LVPKLVTSQGKKSPAMAGAEGELWEARLFGLTLPLGKWQKTAQNAPVW
jgi:hypothetical protein